MKNIYLFIESVDAEVESFLVAFILLNSAWKLDRILFMFIICLKVVHFTTCSRSGYDYI